MMNEFLQEVMPSLLSLLGVIVAAVFTRLGVQVRTYVKDKVITEKLKERPRLALEAVMAIEDAYENANGETKLERAIQLFVDMVNEELGLSISHKIADSLVRSAYQSFKHGLKSGDVVVVEDMPQPDIDVVVEDVEEEDVAPEVAEDSTIRESRTVQKEEK